MAIPKKQKCVFSQSFSRASKNCCILYFTCLITRCQQKEVGLLLCFWTYGQLCLWVESIVGDQALIQTQVLPDVSPHTEQSLCCVKNNHGCTSQLHLSDVNFQWVKIRSGDTSPDSDSVKYCCNEGSFVIPDAFKASATRATPLFTGS